MAGRVSSPNEHREIHPIRFKVVYALLAVVLGASVGGLIVLLNRPASSSAAWSAWKPAGTPGERLRAIANHIGRQYRLQSGRQLVGVVASTARVGDIPVKYLALQEGQSQADISVVSADGSVMFQLCGLGRNCAISEGKPTLARQYLLQRESLELALYTFKYEDAKNVITLLPGKPGTRPAYALFLKKEDFAKALDKPLRRTITPRARVTTGSLTTTDSNLIRTLDQRHLYRFSFQQAPDGSAVLVLASPTA
jgi:hypothetical protein